MAYVIQDQTLTDIADAIREKTGKTDAMTPLQMPDEILSIQGGDSEWDAEPPDDGKMRLYIEVPNPPDMWEGEWRFYNIELSMIAYPHPLVDWGDGTQNEDGVWTHTYTTGGKYIITITPPENPISFYINSSSSSGLMRDPLNLRSVAVYNRMLRKAYIPSMTKWSSTGYQFYYQQALTKIVLPNDMGELPKYLLYNAKSLQEISLPANLKTTNSYSLYGLDSLTQIILPATLNTIDISTFFFTGSGTDNSSLLKMYLKSQSPPNLLYTISNFPKNAIIFVPTGTLEAYQTATNWSNYADQMQEWEVPTE